MGNHQNDYASHEYYVAVPWSSEGNGMVMYRFNIANAGTYNIWGRVLGVDSEHNSFYYSIDSGTQYVWDYETLGYWNWQQFTDRDTQRNSYWLGAGIHTLRIFQRENGAMLDKLLITNNRAYKPTGLGSAAENQGSCGDDVCSPYESCNSCESDCGTCPATCGDGTCGTGETCSNCESDCGECMSSCGDSVCSSDEDCRSCSTDCGLCVFQCGDGTCSYGETCSSCSSDCGECQSVCGNGNCEEGEDCSTCESDCGVCTVCGDDTCDDSESCSSCPEDCGSCRSSNGGGGSSSSYVPTLAESIGIDTQITQLELEPDDRISLNIEDTQHHFTLVGLNAEMAKILIESNPIEDTIRINETKTYDVNASMPLEITLYSIDKGVAYFQFTMIKEQEPEEIVPLKEPAAAEEPIEAPPAVEEPKPVQEYQSISPITGNTAKSGSGLNINFFLVLTIVMMACAGLIYIAREFPIVDMALEHLQKSGIIQDQAEKRKAELIRIVNDVQKWISLARQNGFDDDYIKKVLLARGWNPNTVDHLMTREG